MRDALCTHAGSRRATTLTLLLALAAPFAAPAPFAAQATRPMTFMDMQRMARAGSWDPSPDGKWLLYTVSTPDWEEAESQSDVHVVALDRGIETARRLTFTTDSDELSPTWAPDGSFFVFRSNRTEKKHQLYGMRTDGGEAWRITEGKHAVDAFEFSPDGRWLVYRTGEEHDRQLMRIPVSAAAAPGSEVEPATLADHVASIERWEFSPDGGTLYYVAADTTDADERKRREKGFTVDVRNAVTPLESLWALDIASGEKRKLAGDSTVSVSAIRLSPDGRWLAFSGSSTERYERNITEERLYADVYLLETGTGRLERLTNNHEVGEGLPSFSPDSRWIAFSAPDDLTRYTMSSSRVYLRGVADRGGALRKLGSAFDGDVGVDFWSEDGRTIYFDTGVKVTRQLHALDVATGRVRQVTNVRGALGVSRDEDTGVLLIRYEDPTTPSTLYTVSRLDRVADRGRWTKLVDPNPQVAELALGEMTEVEWTSSDGKRVGGVLVKPVGYRAGERYSLVVMIHGGPASADLLDFNGGYGSQVYAGDGWAVLLPNYRGSTNYGNAHRTDIVGDYFRLGFDDIMTGVDHLIAEGIVDGDRMGALGWSAGGHWSNWILTQTDRFKAISSGAGTMNWISMYAQSDVQRNRQFYMGDGFLYDDFESYWNQSPLKYIRNAKTPTMVHVVAGDPRVPSPQSIELHMALKKLGVPTELYVYPGRSHGIPDARNRLVKAVSEKAWMDYWVRGVGERFEWRHVLETLEPEARPVVSDQGE